jgi:hypothetical protein
LNDDTKRALRVAKPLAISPIGEEHDTIRVRRVEFRQRKHGSILIRRFYHQIQSQALPAKSVAKLHARQLENVDQSHSFKR